VVDRKEAVSAGILEIRQAAASIGQQIQIFKASSEEVAEAWPESDRR
jgi:hypothetical protein